MKSKFLILLIVVVAAGAGWYFLRPKKVETAAGPAYEYAQVERKTVQNIVSATGTLAARELVEVGTQVSGTIQKVLADFNDRVEENQLIALIDTSVLDAQVKSSEADLMRATAQLRRAQIDLDRFKPVHERGFLSDNDFVTYEIAVQTAEAGVLSAEASLDRSRRNRQFAEIRAPISGVVIDRNVEPGQTVAASLNTPRLFTIARDLSQMEILANVDESDIGQIKVGQDVKFSVAAYPDDPFTGKVDAIYLQPEVIQNVVNYTVVVETENPNGRLLPGMTATVDFIVDATEDALTLPAAALNLKMNEAMIAVMQARRQQRAAQGGGGGGGEGGGRPGGFGGGDAAGARRNFAMLWYEEGGELKFLPVRKGVSDGVSTEVLPMRDAVIKEGMTFISKVNNPAAPPAGGSTSQGGPPSGLRRLGF
ncbi:MAG: efflux RND transporter periplasmic adaptor subunit [Opitutaceae bacterium]